METSEVTQHGRRPQYEGAGKSPRRLLENRRIGRIIHEMPGNRITFIVIPEKDGRVRELGLSTRSLWGGGLASVLLGALFGFYALHFHTAGDPERDLAEQRDLSARLEARLDSARHDLLRLEVLMGELAGQDPRHPRGEETLGVGGRQEPDDLPDEYASLPVERRLQDLTQRIDAMHREALYQLTSSEDLIDKLEASKENLLYVPTIWPVADPERVWVSSGFGDRIDPFTGLRSKHLGIDLAGSRGLPIVATANGEVAYAYTDRYLGKVVVINHDPLVVDEDGAATSRPGLLRTEYGHLHKILVAKGERVSRGDTIGTLGSTGRSTGPHLHYAVRYQVRSRGGLNGYRNPDDFLIDWRRDDRPTGSVALRQD